MNREKTKNLAEWRKKKEDNFRTVTGIFFEATTPPAGRRVSQFFPTALATLSLVRDSNDFSTVSQSVHINCLFYEFLVLAQPQIRRFVKNLFVLEHLIESEAIFFPIHQELVAPAEERLVHIFP